jgi:hypothetical protein
MAPEDVVEGDEDYNTDSEDDVEDEDEEWSHGRIASLFSCFGVSSERGRSSSIRMSSRDLPWDLKFGFALLCFGRDTILWAFMLCLIYLSVKLYCEW